MTSSRRTCSSPRAARVRASRCSTSALPRRQKRCSSPRRRSALRPTPHQNSWAPPGAPSQSGTGAPSRLRCHRQRTCGLSGSSPTSCSRGRRPGNSGARRPSRSCRRRCSSSRCPPPRYGRRVRATPCRRVSARGSRAASIWTRRAGGPAPGRPCETCEPRFRKRRRRSPQRRRSP